MISYHHSFSMVFLSCFLLGIAIIIQGANLEICEFVHCENGGTCQQFNSTGGFRCQCAFGFNGTLCENRVNITVCGRNPCKNGGTVSFNAHCMVNCSCPQSHTGNRCETKI